MKFSGWSNYAESARLLPASQQIYGTEMSDLGHERKGKSGLPLFSNLKENSLFVSLCEYYQSDILFVTSKYGLKIASMVLY